MTEMTPIKDILHDLLIQNFATYVQVLPQGLRLKSGKLLPQITGEVLSTGPARTLYQSRKPLCRSLDGLHSLKTKKSCPSCLQRKQCTAQIRLDLLDKNKGVLRFLLAFTSARNYLLFSSSLSRNQCPIEGTTITISVTNRGRWGELCFHR